MQQDKGRSWDTNGQCNETKVVPGLRTGNATKQWSFLGYERAMQRNKGRSWDTNDQINETRGFLGLQIGKTTIFYRNYCSCVSAPLNSSGVFRKHFCTRNTENRVSRAKMLAEKTETRKNAHHKGF